MQKGINNSDLLFPEMSFIDPKGNRDLIWHHFQSTPEMGQFLSHAVDARLHVRYKIMKLFSKNERNQI